MTWQVVQAQLPPQACSSGTSKFLATSRNDSGLPWCEYGSLPCSNSTVCRSPSMMNVTLGIFCSLSGPVTCSLAATVCVRRSCPPAPPGRERFIITSARCLRRVVERLRPLLDRLAVGAVQHMLQAGERRLDPLRARRASSSSRAIVGELRRAQRLLGRLDDRLGFVARVDQQARGEVGLGVLERVEQHPLDLVVGQPVRRLHLDRLLDVGAQLARGDAEDAVGVDLELHLDARQAGRHRRNAAQLEARQRPVVGDQLALALQHVDVDRGLVVDAGREHLAAGRRNRRVAQDDLRRRRRPSSRCRATAA